MSDEKNENHENEDLTAFEAALASLRPRTDRLDRQWRVLLAKEASLTAALQAEPLASRSNGLCNSPAGHQFICVHCGCTAPTARGVHRWTWPAAFSVMTTVAAALLVMLLVRIEQPLVNQVGSTTTSSNTSTGGEKVEAGAAAPNTLVRANGSFETLRGSAGERSLRFFGSDPSRLAESRRGNNQYILTARDIDLPDDLLALNHSFAGNSSTSTHDIQTAEASLTNYELLRQLLKNGDSPHLSVPKPSNSTESQL